MLVREIAGGYVADGVKCAEECWKGEAHELFGSRRRKDWGSGGEEKEEASRRDKAAGGGDDVDVVWNEVVPKVRVSEAEIS